MELEGRTFQVPNDFICPITLEIFSHPVVNMEGRTFEREALLSWLEEHNGTCPLTRKVLKPSDFITDRRMESKIWFWKHQNGLSTEVSPIEPFPTTSRFMGSLYIPEKKLDRIVNRYNKATLATSACESNQQVSSSLASLTASLSLQASNDPTASGSAVEEEEYFSSSRSRPRTRSSRLNFLRRILREAEQLDGSSR